MNRRFLPDRFAVRSNEDGDTQYVLPIPCHSHNDYKRHIPLFDALRAGCTSVEADLWLADDRLLVGHSKASLSATLDFESMYLGPIVRLLELRLVVS